MCTRIQGVYIMVYLFDDIRGESFCIPTAIPPSDGPKPAGKQPSGPAGRSTVRCLRAADLQPYEDLDAFWMVVMHFFYFSVTTMTTTGFGDMFPKTDLARSLVVGQMLVSNVFLVFIFGLGLRQLGMENVESPKFRQRVGSNAASPSGALPYLPPSLVLGGKGTGHAGGSGGGGGDGDAGGDGDGDGGGNGGGGDRGGRGGGGGSQGEARRGGGGGGGGSGGGGGGGDGDGGKEDGGENDRQGSSGSGMSAMSVARGGGNASPGARAYQYLSEESAGGWGSGSQSSSSHSRAHSHIPSSAMMDGAMEPQRDTDTSMGGLEKKEGRGHYSGPVTDLNDSMDLDVDISSLVQQASQHGDGWGGRGGDEEEKYGGGGGGSGGSGGGDGKVQGEVGGWGGEGGGSNRNLHSADGKISHASISAAKESVQGGRRRGRRSVSPTGEDSHNVTDWGGRRNPGLSPEAANRVADWDGVRGGGGAAGVRGAGEAERGGDRVTRGEYKGGGGGGMKASEST